MIEDFDLDSQDLSQKLDYLCCRPRSYLENLRKLFENIESMSIIDFTTHSVGDEGREYCLFKNDYFKFIVIYFKTSLENTKLFFI